MVTNRKEEQLWQQQRFTDLFSKDFFSRAHSYFRENEAVRKSWPQTGTMREAKIVDLVSLERKIILGQYVSSNSHV